MAKYPNHYVRLFAVATHQVVAERNMLFAIKGEIMGQLEFDGRVAKRFLKLQLQN